MVFDRHANLKCKQGERHFCARGSYVDTTGRKKNRIAAYIRRQLEEDQIADRMGLKEFIRIPRHKECPLRGCHASAMQLADHFAAP